MIKVNNAFGKWNSSVSVFTMRRAFCSDGPPDFLGESGYDTLEMEKKGRRRLRI